jgi:23S rRNA pseudouridine1911/1915/1917 synthase
MQDIGHPILGDNKYGNGSDTIGRLCLHAYRLHFYHPRTGEVMRFETPYPRDFLKLFNNATTEPNY